MNSKERRHQWIRSRFGGHRITIENVLRCWSREQAGLKVSERQIRRDLDNIGEQIERGVWFIEATSTKEREKMANKRQKEEIWRPTFFIVFSDEETIQRETKREVLDILQNRLDDEHDLQAEIEDGEIMVIEGRELHINITQTVELE